MATDATGTPTSLGIPTFNINVDAPSGNGSNAQMNVIDTLLQARATLASPAFSGVPTAPSPATADNTTKIATTAFVKAQGYAPLDSPTFTTTAAAPTPATADSSTKIATTAFVKAQGYITSVPVTSVFGRVGVVSPASGDYLASQITNAADLSSGATQSFTGPILAPSFQSKYIAAQGAGGTITPALGNASYYRFIDTSGGTVTIANATNVPGAGTTSPLFIEVVNNGAGTATISWGTSYLGGATGLPASVGAGGARFLATFIYNPSDGAWRLASLN